jgi:penicillin-binding protein 2
LVDQILDAEGNVIEDVEPEVIKELDLKESSVNAILESLHASTLSGGGSYSVFKNFPIATGGKTGTATFKVDQEKYGRAAFAVYTAVAPIDDPQIVVAVIIYDATRGYFAAPVSLAIFEEYFEEELKGSYPNYKRQYNYELPNPISSYGEVQSAVETPVETSTNSNP